MHPACKRPWPLPCPAEELAMTDRTPPALSIDALEDVYDTLAQAIDQAIVCTKRVEDQKRAHYMRRKQALIVAHLGRMRSVQPIGVIDRTT